MNADLPLFFAILGIFALLTWGLWRGSREVTSVPCSKCHKRFDIEPLPHNYVCPSCSAGLPDLPDGWWWDYTDHAWFAMHKSGALVAPDGTAILSPDARPAPHAINDVITLVIIANKP